MIPVDVAMCLHKHAGKEGKEVKAVCTARQRTTQCVCVGGVCVFVGARRCVVFSVACGAVCIDGSPPGSPIPGILQARTLEWVAISFSNSL